jgi:6-phosphogluconate dehydrogenase (decarboxylating)
MLKAAIRYGNVGPDPQGAAGAFHYTIEMVKNGVNYELEVVARQTAINVYEILHFLYYRP